MDITVLTPTYNRKESLEALWTSLRKQAKGNFEWLVVDDGSTDGTEDFIKQAKIASDFPIRYIRKKNGGKHTALNMGIAAIDSDLTFIVDSDDWLANDAISTVQDTFKKYGRIPNICGFSFLRMFPDGKINGGLFSKDELVGSYISTRVNAKDTHSDKAEVFFTGCLKEFPFPEFSNEKFLGEDLVWVRMARKYQMVHFNKAIYIGDYQADGLTKNRRKNNLASPIGCLYRAREFTFDDVSIKPRIKGCVQMIVYGKFAGKRLSEIVNLSHSKALTAAFAPAGLLLYQIWKIELL